MQLNANAVLHTTKMQLIQRKIAMQFAMHVTHTNQQRKCKFLFFNSEASVADCHLTFFVLVGFMIKVGLLSPSDGAWCSSFLCTSLCVVYASTHVN